MAVEPLGDSGVQATTSLRRVTGLTRNAVLIGKDSRLHALDLSSDRPARVVYDVSGEIVYGSDVVQIGPSEAVFSNGRSLLRYRIDGQCREMLSLKEIHIPHLKDVAMNWHINGRIRFCERTGRVYFCLFSWPAGALPERMPEKCLCEFDLSTRACVSIPLGGMLGDVDGVSRRAYLWGIGLNARDMARRRDRVLRKSLGGAPDESLVVPGCVGRCVLTEDGKQLLCSVVWL